VTQKEVFELVIRRFEELGIQYMICGSVGAMLYGKPRLTNDLDVVVAFAPSKIRRFHELFSANGFYCPPAEVILEELRRRGQFNLVHEETGVKVDCMFLKGAAFDREEFARKERRPFSEALEANVARPEDVIIKKLEFFQEGGSIKHIEDIRGILEVSPDKVDRAYLERWVKELGLEAEWRQVEG
jgi:hypothetical protein